MTSGTTVIDLGALRGYRSRKPRKYWDGYVAAITDVQEAVLAVHQPAPVIECECGWGYHCPECGSESNRIIGYACSQCCNSWPHTAYCDDMHNEDGTPLHHPNGVMWSGPHCPVIALIDALRGES